ncbi:hypothetical protein [Caldimonas brevitalea]|uniref:DUF551 domain-containing protein n=1 Tax=Caldimonas brevitalea TaxID=413882 RepID=A0A0G3BQC5_9BURK|nr:hypothetical protein [Caldimonas brevitalea]AKJ28755.1 hypothetical protein AAW51_2064 [Caldimonas brevitalea]
MTPEQVKEAQRLADELEALGRRVYVEDRSQPRAAAALLRTLAASAPTGSGGTGAQQGEMWVSISDRLPSHGQRIRGRAPNGEWEETFNEREPLGMMTHWRPVDVAQQGEPVAWLVEFAGEPELGHYLTEERPDSSECVTPLYPHPPAAKAPEGWKLVPAEPFPSQRIAGTAEWVRQSADDDEPCTDKTAAVYRAMLAAAPAAPQAEPSEEDERAKFKAWAEAADCTNINARLVAWLGWKAAKGLA